LHVCNATTEFLLLVFESTSISKIILKLVEKVAAHFSQSGLSERNNKFSGEK